MSFPFNPVPKNVLIMKITGIFFLLLRVVSYNSRLKKLFENLSIYFFLLSLYFRLDREKLKSHARCHVKIQLEAYETPHDAYEI